MVEPADNIVRMKRWMVERLQGFVDTRAIPEPGGGQWTR